jgi:hypothetical protein
MTCARGRSIAATWVMPTFDVGSAGSVVATRGSGGTLPRTTGRAAARMARNIAESNASSASGGR